MRVVDDISELVGRTPMLRLNKLFSGRPVTVYGKLELCNPMSVKDRPVQHMIRQAMEKGDISAGVELVEASSGNTAIAMAMVGAAMGMPGKGKSVKGAGNIVGTRLPSGGAPRTKLGKRSGGKSYGMDY